MQVRQLEYFASLCETLNFTRTAAEFYVSQTAVTQQIKALEAELGTPLFFRTKRSVSLTPSGSLLREDAKLILRQLKDAEMRVRTAGDDVTGSLKVGFLCGYEHEGLEDALASFHEQYPKVNLTLVRGSIASLYRDLRHDNVDIAFSLLFPKETENCDSWTIRSYPMMLLCQEKHPLAALSTVRMEELAEYPFVMVTSGDDTAGELTAMEKLFAQSGLSLPPATFLTDDVDTAILAVGIGLGCALLPTFITERLKSNPSLVSRPVLGYEEQLIIGALWKRRKENPLVRRLLDICAMKLNR